MTTVFDLLNTATLIAGKNNRTYGSLTEQLSNADKEKQIHENYKSQVGMNYQESMFYDDVISSNRARLLKFG